MKWLIYDTVTGEILAANMQKEDTARLGTKNYANASYTSYKDTIVSNYYYPGGVKTARPKLQVTIGVTTVAYNTVNRITDIPSGTLVTTGINNQLEVTDGELVLIFKAPGKYTVHLEKFPYKPVEVIYYVT